MTVENAAELTGENAEKMLKLIDVLIRLDDFPNVYTRAVMDE